MFMYVEMDFNTFQVLTFVVYQCMYIRQMQNWTSFEKKIDRNLSVDVIIDWSYID